MPHTPRPRPEPDYIKTCTRCGETKTAEQFHSNPNCRDGLQSRCRRCQADLAAIRAKANPEVRRAEHLAWRRKNRESLNARQRRGYRAHPERFADYEVKKRYGLPQGTYAKMIEAQGGKCAICGTTTNGKKRRLAVDHCHVTGLVRGLLCSPCNSGIGHLRHSEALLLSAIEYLRHPPSAESG